jgi:hypothetical protein
MQKCTSSKMKCYLVIGTGRQVSVLFVCHCTGLEAWKVVMKCTACNLDYGNLAYNTRPWLATFHRAMLSASQVWSSACSVEFIF